jgi:hypothetical protein
LTGRLIVGGLVLTEADEVRRAWRNAQEHSALHSLMRERHFWIATAQGRLAMTIV